ncbi:unnamed protein product [Alopecurus aequalis]
MAASGLPSFLRQSSKDTEQSREQQPSSPPFFSGTGALDRSPRPTETATSTDQEAMVMKKIACAVLVAASATVALAAEAPAPAPGVSAGSAATVPALGAVLGATVLSFFAYYLQ